MVGHNHQQAPMCTAYIPFNELTAHAGMSACAPWGGGDLNSKKEVFYQYSIYSDDLKTTESVFFT
jgi:hypothetical protein